MQTVSHPDLSESPSPGRGSTCPAHDDLPDITSCCRCHESVIRAMREGGSA
jgi:hypothetical protein